MLNLLISSYIHEAVERSSLLERGGCQYHLQSTVSAETENHRLRLPFRGYEVWELSTNLSCMKRLPRTPCLRSRTSEELVRTSHIEHH